MGENPNLRHISNISAIITEVERDECVEARRFKKRNQTRVVSLLILV